MGIFDVFKKKKTAVETVSSKSAETNTKKEAADSQPDFIAMSANSYIGNDTTVYEIWKIFQNESGNSDEYKPLEYIAPVMEEADSQPVSTNKNDRLGTELTSFLHIIQRHCDALNAKLKTERAMAKKDPSHQVSPVNAEPILYVTKNKLRLWLIIIPPLGGGDEITADALKFRMDSMSIKYGIDDKMLQKVSSDKMYMKIVQLAVGKAAVHGVNGTCKNLFSKVSNRVNIKEDAHGNVNYKELNMIQSIHKGDVICEITLPTEASDGITVTGETIVGREGKYPNVPAGKNTEFNADKTLLTAKIDGEVLFEDNKFCVKNLLTIESDVDNAVGNINFTGDVLIKGDVREGYTVKADGDVHITGTIECATIVVGGNLQIDRGMNGGGKGTMEIQGSLKCRYLENCHVYAKEGVEVDQVMYSVIATDKNIIVKGKKGSVTGGSLIAGGIIEAETIGARSNPTLKTEIQLGVVPHLIEREKELKKELEELQGNLMKMTQDITYINTNIKQANEERKDLLKNLISQYQIDGQKNKQLEAELNSVSEKIQENTENCGLKCSFINPIINLHVCGLSYVIDREITDCKIVRRNNKTYVMGSNLENMITF